MYYTNTKYTNCFGLGTTELQTILTLSLLTTSRNSSAALQYTPLILTTLIQVIMSVSALMGVLSCGSATPVLARLREFFPLAQFLAACFATAHTEFFARHPALAYFAMSLVLYLQNGKLMLAGVAKTKMSLFHLELLYLWLPSVGLLLQKMEWVDSKFGEQLQVWNGFLAVQLVVERVITCSVYVASQVTKRIGYGFFDTPKPIPAPGTDKKLK